MRKLMLLISFALLTLTALSQTDTAVRYCYAPHVLRAMIKDIVKGDGYAEENAELINKINSYQKINANLDSINRRQKLEINNLKLVGFNMTTISKIDYAKYIGLETENKGLKKKTKGLKFKNTVLTLGLAATLVKILILK